MGTKVTSPKTVLGSSLGENFGFRDNFFYNIQRYPTLGVTYDMTHTRAPTIGVVTPIQGAIFCPNEPRNATIQDAGKPKPSVTTPIVTTPTKYTIYV
jgi:hypothetical protein